MSTATSGHRGGDGWLPVSAQAPGGQQPIGYADKITQIYDVREIVGREHHPRAAGAALRAHAACTRGAHPETARHGGPATPRPATAPGRRRSGPRPTWCDGGRDTGAW